MISNKRGDRFSSLRKTQDHIASPDAEAPLTFKKRSTMDEIKKLPDVAKIDGFIIRKAQSPENSSVLLRYSDQQQDAYELAMPLLEALYLLNLLDAASKREGYDSLRQLIRERKKYS